MAKKLSFPDRVYLAFRGAAKKSRLARRLFVLSCRYLRKGLNTKIREDLPRAIAAFVPEQRKKDREYMAKLEKDIIENGFVYSMSPAEYFLLGIEDMQDREKLQFVGDYEKAWLCQRLESAKGKQILRDKYKTYVFFKAFFGREVIPVCSLDDKDALFAFIKQHEGAIVKLSDSAMGKGVTLVRDDAEEMLRFWDSISQSVREGASYVAEELIRQSAEMAAFHPKSVNTIRMMTFKTRDGVVFLDSFLRLGRGESVVDNAGSGGLFAEIDLEKGVVIGDAITETGERYAVHPDTGVKISGFAIPHWQELLKLSRQLAEMLPEQKYVGWDLALTDEGWVVVEGNSRAQFVNQYPDRNGMRERVRKYFYPELDLTKDY